MAILCVGIAYFLIAVLYPLFLFLTKQYEWPEMTKSGLVFCGLAGVAGAVGALCVVFANRAALGIPNAKLYIAPLIFGLAPVINTLVSVFWHPQKGNPPQSFLRRVQILLNPATLFAHMGRWRWRWRRWFLMSTSRNAKRRGGQGHYCKILYNVH